MRQVGVIAAAARVALADREHLVEDHQLARRLAEGIAERHPDAVELDHVETNMVRVDVAALGLSWDELSDRLQAAGIRVNPPMAGLCRLVTHRDVNGNDVDRLLAALR
jgi:threonine aldolase